MGLIKGKKGLHMLVYRMGMLVRRLAWGGRREGLWLFARWKLTFFSDNGQLPILLQTSSPQVPNDFPSCFPPWLFPAADSPAQAAWADRWSSSGQSWPRRRWPTWGRGPRASCLGATWDWRTTALGCLRQRRRPSNNQPVLVGAHWGGAGRQREGWGEEERRRREDWLRPDWEQMRAWALALYGLRWTLLFFALEHQWIYNIFASSNNQMRLRIPRFTIFSRFASFTRLNSFSGFTRITCLPMLALVFTACFICFIHVFTFMI